MGVLARLGMLVAIATLSLDAPPPAGGSMPSASENRIAAESVLWLREPGRRKLVGVLGCRLSGGGGETQSEDAKYASHGEWPGKNRGGRCVVSECGKKVRRAQRVPFH